MLILDSVNKSIELILGGTVAANQLPFVASYIDVTTTTYTPNSNDGVSNNAVAVAMIAAPVINTQRQVKLITVHNADIASVTVTLRLNNNGTFRTICKVVLSTLTQLIYTDGEGFRVIDANGGIVQGNNVISLTSQVSGILPVANGGTGVSTLSDVLGTANQVTVTGGTARVIGGNVTLALPQNIHTGATPQFARLGIGAAADGTIPLYVAGNALIGNVLANIGASGGEYPSIGYNVTYTGSSGVWNYRTTDTAFLLKFGASTILFKIALSGTAGNAITFTDIMSIGIGNVGIGTASPATSALLELSSTIGALLITRMTTTQKNALTPVNGMIVYDSTLGKFQGYEAGAWNNFSVL